MHIGCGLRLFCSDKCLSKCSTDDEVGEEAACELGLTCGANAAAVGCEADADAWTNGAETIADKFQGRDDESRFHL